MNELIAFILNNIWTIIMYTLMALIFWVWIHFLIGKDK